MPQLDGATFLSQVFWLTVIFVSYYRVSVNFLLPSRATWLKARSKKVSLAKGRVSGYDGERQAATSRYDVALTTSSRWVSTNVLGGVSAGEAWRAGEVRGADEGQLVSANREYLGALSACTAQGLLVTEGAE
jgi:hypothetical protein